MGGCIAGNGTAWTNFSDTSKGIVRSGTGASVCACVEDHGWFVCSDSFLYLWGRTMRHIFSLFSQLRRLVRDNSGSVFVEYLLLVTIVGIGTIAGLVTIRGALLSELVDLADAIASM